MQLQTVPAATMPGYRIADYLLALEPHEELSRRLMKVKKEFSAKYAAGAAAAGKPRLPLVRFLQYEMMEERILNRLRMVAMGFPAFKVELKDFGSFPSHTIYVNVTSKIPVQKLVKEIRHETQRLMKLKDDNKPHFILEPHITLAAKLLPRQYEKGWQEYSRKHFTGRFIAYGMWLLKRPAGEQRWQVRERFEFQNMPVATRQGVLFL